MRRLLVVAAADGLVLQPLGQRNLPNPPTVGITYRTNIISSLKVYSLDSAASSFEAYGVVGLLNVSSTSLLIAITRRQQVAQLRGKPIFVITEIAFVPLASQAEASAAIIETRDSFQKHHKSSASEAGEPIEHSDSSAEEDVYTTGNGEFSDDDLSAPTAPELLLEPVGPRSHRRRTSIAEDVIGKKGLYGRFAGEPSSKRGWNVEGMHMQGMSTENSMKGDGLSVLDGSATTSKSVDTDEVIQPLEHGGRNSGQAVSETSDVGGTADSATSTLLPKLLRTTKLLLGSSRGFFYSYEHDITRNLESQDPNISGLPLHKVVDPLYFWNRHLVLPFIEAGQHALVLPVMQGFVGQRSFSASSSTGSAAKGTKNPLIKAEASHCGALQGADRGTDDTELLLTLISRRSVKRAGLRYLRRGVDEDGNAANSVETEQILSHPSGPSHGKAYSFVQIRGSIPLYFSQSPYSFKPVPVMQHSPSTNQAAFKKHFLSLIGRYSNVQVASLVEKNGNEAQVGTEYQKNIDILNLDGGVAGVNIGFEWFDFHAVCRGMRFEKVSLLVDSLSHMLDEFGCTIKVDGKTQVRQRGVLRTNCMDCLDRTNVVQSACARRVLESQLKAEGLEFGNKSMWFDMLWADNGDAISKQYASTAALKGDFTRTRRRDYRGALNDFGLSLSRYFNNIIGDYFTQAAVDYLLGNVTSQVFGEFEAEMMTADPAISMRRVRQDAIETCSKIVIADESEELIDGWTLLTSKEQNSTRSLPFEESILLLTDAALYACRFDWNMEKVSSFERVDLLHVQTMTFGTYITSTLAPAHTDEKRNVGFVVTYRPGSGDVVRVNTRSLKSTLPGTAGPTRSFPATNEPPATRDARPETSPGSIENKSPDSRILAFKAIPIARSLSIPDHVITELDLIRIICEEIERAATTRERVVGRVSSSNTSTTGPTGMVKEGPIISLVEARKSTGLLERVGYELKRLVWA